MFYNIYMHVGSAYERNTCIDAKGMEQQFSSQRKIHILFMIPTSNIYNSYPYIIGKGCHKF